MYIHAYAYTHTYIDIHTQTHTHAHTHTHIHAAAERLSRIVRTAIPIIIEGQFQVFQRFSSSKLVLKPVESCFAALDYYGNGSNVESRGVNISIPMYIYTHVHTHTHTCRRQQSASAA